MRTGPGKALACVAGLSTLGSVLVGCGVEPSPGGGQAATRAEFSGVILRTFQALPAPSPGSATSMSPVTFSEAGVVTDRLNGGATRTQPEAALEPLLDPARAAVTAQGFPLGVSRIEPSGGGRSGSQPLLLVGGTRGGLTLTIQAFNEGGTMQITVSLLG